MEFSMVLREVFARQRELMAKYKSIERLPNPPISVQTSHGQRIFRDFAQRVNEELAEARAAEGLDTYEEWADGLHFIVEMLIYAGINYTQLDQEMPERKPVARTTAYAWAYHELNLAMNFLKNKPWKRTHVPTDEGRFRAQLITAFGAYIQLAVQLGLDETGVYNHYFRKAEVNELRVRSNY